jgi:hypothetical protein
MDPDRYCRAIESYLCQKNDGHLIRIAGPSFELVRGWAARGIPLKVAQLGIDRYFDRYYASGPKRRPVRIHFCEADVLDAFDEWRRAVGVRGWETETSESDEAKARTKSTLASHIDRVIARLTALRAGRVNGDVDRVIERHVAELDLARAGARRVRGTAREELLSRLRFMDRELIQVVVQQYDPDALARLRIEAAEDLEPFRARMSSDVFVQAVDRALERLVRERSGLPQVAFE